MQKILTALAVAASLAVSVAPKKSEAGLVIGYIAGDAGTGALIGGGVGVGILGVGLVFADGNPFSDPISQQIFLYGFGGGAALATILDVDGNLPAPQLMDFYRKKFSFIDNSEVLRDMVDVTNEILKERTKAAPHATEFVIQVSPERMDRILSFSDISEEQRNEVIRAFE